MIGKIKVTSTGYDPDNPPVKRDNTLDHAKTTKEIALTPIGRRVMLAPEERDEYRHIHVPKGALAKELRLCVVLSVGPKVKLTHPQLVPGRPVWIKPFFGTEIVVNGNAVLFVLPEDVTGCVGFD